MSPLQVRQELAALFAIRNVAEEAKSVRQAARELRSKGHRGSLHFRVDTTGRAIQIDPEEDALRREIADLRRRKADHDQKYARKYS